MTQPENPPSAPRRADGDRRGTDRRHVERRSPPALWRRPWAYVAYGLTLGAAVVGGLALLREPAAGGDPPIQERDASVPPPRDEPVAAAPEQPVQEARGAAGFERLMLEGAGAVGRQVRTQLFCDQPRAVLLRETVRPEAAIAPHASGGRVPAAECKWGGANEERREDFILVVPADRAAEFASAPLVTDEYQQRRRLNVQVEWLGTSESLSLRPSGVFRGLSR